MAIFLIAAGLLFTGLDFHVATGIFYPAYVAPQGEYMGVELGDVIQVYVKDYILGDQIRLDILPDLIGCVLIIAGLCMLVKHNKRYIDCVALAVVTGSLSVLLRVLPMYVNSAARIVMSLLVFALIPFFELLMEYKVIYTTVSVSDDMAVQGTNRRMQFLWWVTVACRVFIALLTFAGLTGVKHWYQAALVVFTLLYLYQLLQTRRYVGTYKVYKEGFNSAVLPDYIKEKIKGSSYRENPDITLDDLRFVRILHYDFNGMVQEGELIVNKAIAYQTMRAFYQLYKLEYPIEKVRLVDEYEADDELSMEDNNSSAFNYRTVEGRDELSQHALGLAIDINPLINPYVRSNEEYYPVNAGEYLERDPQKCTGAHSKKMIQKKDFAYKTFARNGFLWGGDWSRERDYQHFYVPKP